MSTIEIPDQIEFEIPCPAPGCEGRGFIEHPNIRIDPAYQKKHLKEHAYTVPQGEKHPIGANCDCPSIIGEPTRGECQSCKGTGVRHVFLKVPKPGAKVRVKDGELLEQIFGDEVPERPGKVYDIQTPEQHHLELLSGLGVRVTWDGLLSGGRIPKGKQVDLWTFDLMELEIVR